MAKRFTDTQKWEKNFFSKLDNDQKLIWIYLLDRCDHAGVYEINLGLMSYQLGFDVDLADFELFGDKIHLLPDDKIYIPSFIEFQYGTLNPDNKVHKSVLDRLEKVGASKGLGSSIQGAKDKDKEKDQEKDKEKDPVFDFEKAYAVYPKRPNTNKGGGIKRLKSQIKTQADFDRFLLATTNYASWVKTERVEEKFIKQFQTFCGPDCWPEWVESKIRALPLGIVEE